MYPFLLQQCKQSTEIGLENTRPRVQEMELNRDDGNSKWECKLKRWNHRTDRQGDYSNNASIEGAQLEKQKDGAAGFKGLGFKTWARWFGKSSLRGRKRIRIKRERGQDSEAAGSETMEGAAEKRRSCCYRGALHRNSCCCFSSI